MNKKYYWFKFDPANWMMGRIQRCDEVVQARFIRLCCTYWNKQGILSLEDAIAEVDEDVYQQLKSKKIIVEEKKMIHILFLDEQLQDILDLRKKKSDAGKKSAEKRRANAKHKLNTSLTGDEHVLNTRATDIEGEGEGDIEGDIEGENNAHEPEAGLKTQHRLILEKLKTAFEWRENIQRQLGIEEAYLDQKLCEFIGEQKIKEDLDRPDRDIKNHFFQWIKIEVRKDKPSTTKTETVKRGR